MTRLSPVSAMPSSSSSSSAIARKVNYTSCSPYSSSPSLSSATPSPSVSSRSMSATLKRDDDHDRVHIQLWLENVTFQRSRDLANHHGAGQCDQEQPDGHPRHRADVLGLLHFAHTAMLLCQLMENLGSGQQNAAAATTAVWTPTAALSGSWGECTQWTWPP